MGRRQCFAVMVRALMSLRASYPGGFDAQRGHLLYLMNSFMAAAYSPLVVSGHNILHRLSLSLPGDEVLAELRC